MSYVCSVEASGCMRSRSHCDSVLNVDQLDKYEHGGGNSISVLTVLQKKTFLKLTAGRSVKYADLTHMCQEVG